MTTQNLNARAMSSSFLNLRAAQYCSSPPSFLFIAQASSSKSPLEANTTTYLLPRSMIWIHVKLTASLANAKIDKRVVATSSLETLPQYALHDVYPFHSDTVLTAELLALVPEEDRLPLTRLRNSLPGPQIFQDLPKKELYKVMKRIELYGNYATMLKIMQAKAGFQIAQAETVRPVSLHHQTFFEMGVQEGIRRAKHEHDMAEAVRRHEHDMAQIARRHEHINREIQEVERILRVRDLDGFADNDSIDALPASQDLAPTGDAPVTTPRIRPTSMTLSKPGVNADSAPRPRLLLSTNEPPITQDDEPIPDEYC
ncbi:hypothetical protein EJ08DRAFT_702635 [Tothia fuscella]|uniref:Uncharacterized protein n=1 Tax=Tothia fuscella TaxID=1048955 RepID=A0A9P4NG03_9PEZI|nr:hypothetical protein EJ08DRAFT_702635 [Tothia fuscella]